MRDRNKFSFPTMSRQLLNDLKMRIENEAYNENEIYTENDLVNTLSIFNRTLDNVGEDIAIIQEWLKSQKHILIETSVKEILYFLISCKFSFEKTKEKLNMYYCIRNMLPEYYKNVKPSSEKIQEILSVCNLIPLPYLTPEFNRVVVVTINSKMVSKFKSDIVNSYLALMMDFQPLIDICLCNEYIIDFSQISLELLLKYSIMDVKKILTVLEKVYSTRVARIHFINAPGYCSTLISVVNSFLKDKMKKRIFMHKGYEPLFDYIPKTILPSDFGGEADSLAKTHERIQMFIKNYEDHFEKLNGNAVDEKLRPETLQNDDILGFHGSFKKLQVD